MAKGSETLTAAGAFASEEKIDLRASRYDLAASMMVSALVLVGFAVLILFLIWLTARLMVRNVDPPILLEDFSGRQGAFGTARDLEPPGLEEVEDLTEPQLEETLEAVTDAVSSQAAALDVLEGDTASSTRGSGLGDSRQAGPGGTGNFDGIPRWQRWQIQYEAADMDLYAKQLDFFGVELAAIGGGQAAIDYASKFSGAKPQRRSGPSKTEQRLYMTWRHGPLKRADEKLLKKAGIPTKGRLIVQFYPPPVENLIAQVEAKYAKGRPIKEIKKTVFSVRRKGSGFEFFVIDQRFRL